VRVPQVFMQADSMHSPYPCVRAQALADGHPSKANLPLTATLSPTGLGASVLGGWRLVMCALGFRMFTTLKLQRATVKLFVLVRFSSDSLPHPPQRDETAFPSQINAL
jgi:hypothetical protein